MVIGTHQLFEKSTALLEPAISYLLEGSKESLVV